MADDNTDQTQTQNGFSLFGGDPNSVDPNTGLTLGQRQQMLYSQLASMGGLLMAAGQKQMPAERAKYLAQLGQVPGQMFQQMDTMQQMRLTRN